EFIYQIGDDSDGWSIVHPLRSAVEDDVFTGIYTGYAYLNTEFKFRSHEDSWDAPDWGAGSEEGKLEAQAGNITVPAAGFYQLVVDMEKMTYTLTPASIGVIGSFNGWAGDEFMTYNAESGALEVTISLTAGDEIKFRLNSDWAVNWGGDLNDLTQDGANIAIDADGTYKIQLFLTYAGGTKAVITKQ
ncbi:MAG: SusF/SusE family outer membrane protein, partial [Prevotella sp.]|nr:SusF/SusE family outer membrane protein [Prevotella sp.]